MPTANLALPYIEANQAQKHVTHNEALDMLDGFAGAGLAGFRNALINGCFRFWQRGLSFNNPASNSYLADRWVIVADGSGATRTFSRQSMDLGAVPGEPQHFLRWDQSVAGTGATFQLLAQRLEGVRTLAGLTVTFSAWLRADAPRQVTLIIRQSFGSSGSPNVDSFVVVNVTTAWQRFSLTASLPSMAGKTIGTNNRLEVQIRPPLNTVLTLDVAQAQLEAGPVATPFERRHPANELALCQRYFEKSYGQESSPGAATGASGISWTMAASGQNRVPISFCTTKCAVPTITFYNPVTGASGSWRDVTAPADRTMTAAQVGERGFGAVLAGGVASNFVEGHWTAESEV